MSNAGGAESSSSMISLQRSMHSSQMYTPGPAISFLTCRCDLPQKLQRSCSFESVGRAINPLPDLDRVGYLQNRRLKPSVLRDHPVDDSVFLRLLGAHEIVAFRVPAHLVQILARVLGDDLIQ